MDEASGSHEDELPVEGKQVLDQVCRHTRQQHLTGRVGQEEKRREEKQPTCRYKAVSLPLTDS